MGQDRLDLWLWHSPCGHQSSLPLLTSAKPSITRPPAELQLTCCISNQLGFRCFNENHSGPLIIVWLSDGFSSLTHSCFLAQFLNKYMHTSVGLLWLFLKVFSETGLIERLVRHVEDKSPPRWLWCHWRGLEERLYLFGALLVTCANAFKLQKFHYEMSSLGLSLSNW